MREQFQLFSWHHYFEYMPAEKPTEPQNRENNNTRGYQQHKNEAQIDQVINVTLRGVARLGHRTRTNQDINKKAVYFGDRAGKWQ